MKYSRRVISLAVAVGMMLPSLATAVEAAMVTWLSPQPGQRLTTSSVEVAVGYNTQSSTKVTKLELWVDGKLHTSRQLVRAESRGVCSLVWNTTRYSDGPHELVVKVYSGDVLISEVTSTGTVGNTAFDMDPPVVIFSGIKNGDVLKGVTEIKIDATDDSGEPPLVSLRVDKALKLVKNRPPYTYDLDTTTYADGSHELETYAYDGAGNRSTPAVLNVSFRNNVERPVVTTVTVAPTSTVAASEDDGIGTVVEVAPVAKVPPVATPNIRTETARTSAAPGVTPSAGKPVAPAVTAPATAPKPVTQPKAEVKSEPKVPQVVSTPKPVAEPVEKVSTRTPEVVARAQELASKPIQVIARPPAELASIAAAEPDAAVPETRTESHSVSTSPALEAREPVNPDTSRPEHVMIAKAPGIREMDHVGFANSNSGAQEMLADPVAADPKVQAPAPVPATDLRSDKQAGMASVGKRVALAPPAPKPGKAVADSFVNDINAAPKQAIKQLPPAKLEHDAKLEKKLIPASGKVKIRDVVDKLGGIVFWDQENKTVTAYAGDMQMVLTVGSKIARVNGKDMPIDSAPYIVNGRTVINAQVYHQAVAFANNTRVASSKK